MKPTSLQQKILNNRNIPESDWVSFMLPDFEKGVYDPFLLPDMEKSVARILAAIKNNEKIVIYSDYDCDGIPGAVVLHDFFREIGYKNFSNYIPHRHNEGYGLNQKAIENFAKNSVKLLVTVDLGITNTKEVEYANTLGLEIIITDHHLPHTENVKGKEVQILPKAFAVINAKRYDNIYPDNMLSGCATAWKLVCALIQRGKDKKETAFENIGAGFTKWLLDLVAISTIADMVPLQNENRVLAHYGLIVLRKTKRPGLIALFKKSGIKQTNITEEDIGFGIAPRLNSASRMDNPIEAFYLLATKDELVANEKAAFLEKLNTSRKENVAVFMKKAHKLASTRLDKKVLVLGDSEWSPGVLGLIASKLKDDYKKTVFVWGQGEDKLEYKGSCRSDGETHLVDLMQACREETFSHMGGHELAGGFSLKFDKIHNLEEELERAYKKTKHIQIESKDISFVDGTLKIFDINTSLYHELNRLAPFGVLNQKPIFEFKNVLVKEVSLFGKTRNHLKIRLEQEGKAVEAIKFFVTNKTKNRKGEEIEVLPGDFVSLEAFIEKDMFGYKKDLRLRVVDFL